MGSSSWLHWPTALATILAYSFNSQVFVWIGSADFGGKLFELFLFHVCASFFLLYFLARGSTELKTALAERGKCSLRIFALQVVVGAFFQMEIYYFWFRASLKLPTQLLAAIFQTAIVLVYVFSLAFLGEKLSCFKACAVLLAVLGVVLATFLGECLGQTRGVHMPSGVDLLRGVLLALGAEVSKALYQVWFKRSFGDASPKFALLFGGLVGVAHLFPVLPLVALLHWAGVPDANMVVSAWTSPQIGLILLAAAVAGAVNVGSLAVIAMKSPMFWSSIQLLAIPISVILDFVFRGIEPSVFNCAGYFVIVIACLMMSGVLAPQAVEAHGEEESSATKTADDPSGQHSDSHCLE
eukprot:CAMPEP_0171070490 /NCGR_PEP_ID=MMETSP0766_2-20121228/9780_1 /TAXON_ID=439317 /ORGANISM="Gambierdiscus australes, Strain CAWD 149" /LENGTH=352 /DNA_ID=CAMNT_0011526973 /DNA_START=38 /DNA_END=1096 /DNA_ORIENTATION=+